MPGALFLVIALLPLAQAVTLEDPAGDVRVELYETTETAMPEGFDGLDLRSLSFEETVDDIVITVGVEGLPECYGGVCADAADLRTHFTYGNVTYFTQMGMTLDGYGVGRLNEDLGGGAGRLIDGSLATEVSAADNTFKLFVPRGLIVDESGAPLIMDRTIDAIWTNSYGQFNLGGPSPDLQNSQDMFVTRDDMGIDEPAQLTLMYGGVRGEGPIELRAEAPFRSSNGGAATYAYNLEATNTGDAADFTLTLQDVPAGWTVEKPNGTLHLEADEVHAFTVIMDTPMGHQHGGSDVFTARLEKTDDTAVWSSVDLGVHYLDVPQPAGHHPDIWLHARDIGTIGAFSSAAGGTAGDMWMNTLAEDADDDQVNVGGYSVEGGVQWSVCLRPELLLGIDLNATKEGFLDVTLESAKFYQGVTVSGRLIHVGPGSDIVGCYPDRYAERDQTVIATFEASAPVDLNVGDATNPALTAVVTPEGERVPYVSGSTLVLQIDAQYAVGFEGGADGLLLRPGGLMRLPIDEYRDERPAGYVAGSVEVVGEVEDFVQEAVTEKESPMPVTLLPLLAALLLMRRR